MSEAVLKSCPFCGGEPGLREQTDAAQVFCLCGARGPEIVGGPTATRAQEAVAAWNKRPTEDALVEGLETAHGQSHIWEPDSYALEMVRMSIETCLENLGIVSQKIRKAEVKK